MNAHQKIVPAGCDHDFRGRCVLKAHVRNGVIIALETDNENHKYQ